MTTVRLLLMFASAATALYAVGAMISLEFDLTAWSTPAKLLLVAGSALAAVALHALTEPRAFEGFDHYSDADGDRND